MSTVSSKVQKQQQQQQQQQSGEQDTSSSSSQLPASASSSSSIADTSASSAATADQSNVSSSTMGATGTDADLDVITTVFQDQNHFNVKHPLWNTWTLWFDNPTAKAGPGGKGGKDAWGELQIKVVTIDSVEEFWGLYNNIIPPSELPPKANYYLFKDGIRPAWEDPANTNGGKWSIQLPRDKSKESINTLWLHTMLQAIGETLEASFPDNVPNQSSSIEDELVTGVIMSARPNFYRIAIWTRKADDDLDAHAASPKQEAAETKLAKRLLDIGRQFKVNVLGYKLDARAGAGSSGFATEVEFQSHRESEKKRGKKTTL
ncbi:eukaryotic translation initiation factor 4E [Tilletia horrida]|nr:eukaryotic translation initiation factor 4E [Tilletia horrida]KAK0565852.1 eukaryotic translation initiation factor 4E [Tilletia horrida]